MARMSLRWWLVLLLSAGLGGAGAVFFTSQGFETLQQLRQMERIPLTRNIAVLPGEVKVAGTAEGATIASHFTQTPCLYFQYIREVEERDSDGNTSWKTVENIRRASTIALRDSTAVIQLLSQRDQSHIEWQVARSFTRTDGSTRHTEYRIDPGQQLVAFGFAESRSNGMSLGFRQAGQYNPVITTNSSASVLGKIGASVLFRLWLGLTLSCVAIYALVCMFGIHRVLVFISIIAVTVALVLVQLSLLMMKADLHNAVERYDKQQAAVEVALRQNAIDALQSREMRLALAMSHTQLHQQFQRIPERWLAPLWQISLPALEVVISPQELELLQERKRGLDDVALSSVSGIWIMGISALVAVLAVFFGVKLIFVKRAIENIRTSKVVGVSCGLNEVLGRVEAINSRTLEAPLAGVPCMWYRYRVKEKRSSGGKTRWVTIEDRKEAVPFLCVDESGSLKIYPAKAEVISKHSESQYRGSRHYFVEWLASQDSLYALGPVAIDMKQDDRLCMREAGKKSLYLLSNLTERALLLRKARAGLALLTLAYSAGLYFVLAWLGLNGRFATTDFLFAAMLSPVFLLNLMIILHYNDLVFLRKRAMRNRANIEVALRKRKNLVPALNKIAHKFMQHEEALLRTVADMRRQWSAISVDSAAQGDLEHLVHQATAVVEAYPQLKAHSLTAKLIQQLTHLENEIAVLRQGYNDAVEEYNSRCKVFPDLLLARAFKFKLLKYI
ncbi:hypothetical protein TDB9533_04738 [Thalassocella blandensis]|nr:hypothetical protein TDB9533_04738 [Thalassocella blandensis]